jgi:ligand-binding sensor domain-containing protein/signal transduction histidine kinase
MSRLAQILPSLRGLKVIILLIAVSFWFAFTSNGDINPLASKPIAIKNQDGHLELLKVDSNGQLRHRWQNLLSGEWSSWHTLGSSCEPGVAVTSTPGGEIVVFAVDQSDHSLKLIHQKSTNSLEWSDWLDLGGSLATPLTATCGANGKLAVFAVDTSSHSARYIRQNSGLDDWSGWRDLGGSLLPGLAITLNKDGHLELFGIAAETRALMHCYQRQAEVNSEWTEWSSLGGSLLPGFAVSSNVLGRVEVFAVSTTNNNVERICQNKPGDSRHWGNWTNFGFQAKPGLVVGQSSDRRLELIAIGLADSRLMHRWEMLPNGVDQWSPWGDLGITTIDYPAVVANEDGDLEVFVVDPENPEILNHRRQISKSSGWLDWSRLEHPTFQYSSRTWQTDEGLPHNTVQAIAQGRDGYLWVGTHAGLARFNGLDFAVFEPRSAPDLAGASITSLCSDHDGVLWIGTQDRGLFRMLDGECTRYTITNGLAGNSINVVYQRHDGSLWIGTSKGLSRLSKGQFTTFTRQNGLSSNFVRSLFEDRDGNLWIATGEGLNRLRSPNTMDTFPMPQGLPNDSVRCICQDHGDRIWIGSSNGMLWYGPYWQKFFAYNTRYGLSDPFVSAICEDREGNLWVGTYSGLNRFREGHFLNQLDNQGVPFDHVNALFEDRESNLWVGSKEGLIRLTPKRFTTITKRQGLTHNNVMAVVESQDDTLCVGTWGGGICAIKDGHASALNSSTNLSQSLVLSLARARDGGLWVGADFDGGLTRLNGPNSAHFSSRDGLPKAPVRVLHEDHAGALWIGTDLGLVWFHDGKFKTYTTHDGLPGNSIHDLCDDDAGGLWIGTEAGLSHWQTNRFTNLTVHDGLSDNHILALYQDAESSLWIGTSRGGLDRLTLTPTSRSRFRIRSYTTARGLFSDEIFEIVEDDEGWLWMTCSKAVFRIKKRDFKSLDQGNRDSLVSLVYGRSDGMESPQCNDGGKPSAIKTADGHLCFCTSKGLAIVDPDTVTINVAPPPVRVEQVTADRKPMLDFNAALHNQEFQTPAGKLWNANSTGPIVKMPPGRGELEFRYAALTFESPEETRFKYQLKGVDADWVDAGTRRTAHYNNVAPGRHIFQVLACNKDGAWNERGATIVFQLEPHMWQTWWWRGGLVLAAILLAGGIVRYVTNKRVQRKLAALEQRNAIEKERGRIAKDIHDDLGSSLTRIMMLGERAEEDLLGKREVENHVGKIVATARHTVRALDEIVWAVNPENDTLDGLVQYISHYADEVFENSEISWRLDIPTNLPAINLSAEVRHDLFLIVKEAFHNVLKHSRASQVRVQISTDAAGLALQIEDNGCGFSANSSVAGRKGNGLRNMEKRIQAIDGQLTLSSTPGKGTVITLAVPLAQESYIHTVGNGGRHS